MARTTKATRGVTKRKPPKKEKRAKKTKPAKQPSEASVQEDAVRSEEASPEIEPEPAPEPEPEPAPEPAVQPTPNSEPAPKAASEHEDAPTLVAEPDFLDELAPVDESDFEPEPAVEPEVESSAEPFLAAPPSERLIPHREEAYDAQKYTREGTAQRVRIAKDRRRGVRRWVVRIVVAVVVVAIVVGIAFFSWNRWLRYDDAADLQGSWQVDGTTSEVVIDGTSMQLSDDVSYDYTIDSGSKTITYTFGSLEGQGRYRFSDDRSQVAIVDGDYSWRSTLFDDIGWSWGQTLKSIQGKDSGLSDMDSDENATVLDRVS